VTSPAGIEQISLKRNTGTPTYGPLDRIAVQPDGPLEVRAGSCSAWRASATVWR
jgi:hypothetical protein